MWAPREGGATARGPRGSGFERCAGALLEHEATGALEGQGGVFHVPLADFTGHAADKKAKRG